MVRHRLLAIPLLLAGFPLTQLGVSHAAAAATTRSTSHGVVTAGPNHSCDDTWNGASSTWNSGAAPGHDGNWSTSDPPTETQYACLPAGNYTVTINNSGPGWEALGLWMGAGVTLDIVATGSGEAGLTLPYHCATTYYGLINNGTIRFDNPTGAQNLEWINNQDGYGCSGPSGDGYLHNYGSIIVDQAAGSYPAEIDGPLDNQGTVTVQAGTLALDANWQNDATPNMTSGTITIDSGGTLSTTVGHNPHAFDMNGGTVSNGGTFAVNRTYFDANAGSITGNAVQVDNSTLLPSGTGTAAFTLDQSTNFIASDIASGYSITMPNGGEVDMDGASNGGVTNHGVVTLTSTGTNGNQAILGGVSFANAGTFDAGGTGNPVWYPDLRIPVANSGTFVVAGGATLDQALTNDGTLTGTGALTGTITNAGTVDPGASATSPGTLTISGGFTQQAGGTLHIDADGSASGQYDQLAVTGSATLAGALQVSAVGSLTSGTALTVLSDGSQSGTFSSTPQGYTTAYQPTSVTVTPQAQSVTTQETGVQLGGWAPASNASANGGGYRISGVKNDSATYHFSGTSLTWLTATGPAYGEASVSIDGTSKGTVDLYSASPVWQVSKTFSGLSTGKHKLIVKVLGAHDSHSTGTAVVLDAFIAGSTTAQETSPSVEFDTWLGKTSTASTGGAYRVAKTKNASATFSFSGTSVTWVTATGPGDGIAQVYIDGVSRGSVDLYSKAAQWQVARSYSGLSAGTHTIEVVVTGTHDSSASGASVVVDAFVTS